MLHAVWGDDLDFIAYDDEGHSFIMSASQPGGYVKKGVGPMEGVLYSLMGCTGMDVVTILKRKKVPIKGLELRINSAERAKSHPKVYTRIEMEYIFHGSNLPMEELERAVELSTTKFCSVSKMLENGGVEIIRKITVVEE